MMGCEMIHANIISLDLYLNETEEVSRGAMNAVSNNYLSVNLWMMQQSTE